jgi:hypothetical protein
MWAGLDWTLVSSHASIIHATGIAHHHRHLLRLINQRSRHQKQSATACLGTAHLPVSLKNTISIYQRAGNGK